MIWFGRNLLAHVVYGPAAVAGLLLPFAFFPGAAQEPEAAVLGASLVHAAVAAALMRFGMRTSFAFAVWAFAGIASLLVHRKVLLPPTRCCVLRLFSCCTCRTQMVCDGTMCSGMPTQCLEHRSFVPPALCAELILKPPH